MFDRGPKIGQRSAERVAATNAVIDSIASMLDGDPRTCHMDSREPAAGLLLSTVATADLARFQQAFAKGLDLVQSRWIGARQPGDDMPQINYATMDIIQFNGELFSVTSVHSASGGISRQGMIVQQDHGIERMYYVFADENGTMIAYQESDAVKDDFYAEMVRLFASDPTTNRLFNELYYGAVDYSEYTIALDYLRSSIVRAYGQEYTDRLINELRDRYKSAREANKLREQLGERGDMTNEDLLLLSRKFA